MKVENEKYQGFLIPLQVLRAMWEDVTMDFITCLPKVRNLIVLVVVVDCLNKYCHVGAHLPITQQQALLCSW